MIEKLNIEINSTTMEFSQNGEKIEFDIPQRALKLLCNYVYEAQVKNILLLMGCLI